MSRRTPTTVRLSTTEKRVLQAAAERREMAWTVFMREVALDEAVETLERELEDVKAPEADDASA